MDLGNFVEILFFEKEMLWAICFSQGNVVGDLFLTRKCCGRFVSHKEMLWAVCFTQGNVTDLLFLTNFLCP